LKTEFERAREQSGQRLRDAMAPYARFVDSETRRWTETQQTLSRLRDVATGLLTQLTAVKTPSEV
jgi:hypothetical protein